MTATIKHRWINAALSESALHMPVLPWERAAKRARRIESAQNMPMRALA
ncbi:hypothetical protein LY56_01907 [Roseinatronobacter thiooxidans]|uniref:Uncharacterized protein n=1 Tax=Roseinatronobacter thiooxidans TaxID=121821 RepID=A0A2W7QKY9_9RHOB|nr:hypothetical protein [Roseinatronobacter thiooxidans]PZX44657.1 hypothetical protein LY56_01907 [Roseinatronobacter thiooxidans]